MKYFVLGFWTAKSKYVGLIESFLKKMDFISLYFFNFIVGSAGACFVMKYGTLMGIGDIPNQRSSHTKIIPKCGGIGVAVAFVVSCLFLSIPMSFWFPTLMISLISFWGGDKHRLSASKRLGLQFLCGLIFLFFVGSFKGFLFNSIFMWLLLSIFIVGTSNFYNFMDGIDGIAGVTGVTGFSLLAFYAFVNGIEGPYVILCLTLAFSCLGFLIFNLPRARVFLGDVGSVLLGFLFACMMIMLSEKVTDLLVMVGFLSTFYFDEIFTMAVRIYNKESLLKPHRNHIYQLLVNELSVSHWKIALIYGAIQALIGLSVIYFSTHGLLPLLILYVFYCSLFTCISIKIRRMVISK